MLSMKLTARIAFCLLALPGAPAFAEIYKCSDESGVITFTDNPKSVPEKSCKAMNLEPVNIVSAPPSSTGNRKPARRHSNGDSTSSSASTPSAFPNVDRGTQQKRDLTRRQILEDERATEQRLLSEVQDSIGRLRREGAQPQKINELQTQALAHQKNIEALEKELARLR